MATKSLASTLPGLTASDFADLAARRRSASSRLQSAIASSTLQRQRARSAFDLSKAQINREAGKQQTSALTSLADIGMARNPRTAGRAVQEIRDDAANRIGLGSADLADREAALQAVIDEARRARDRELAEIEAAEVRRRSNYGRLMGV